MTEFFISISSSIDTELSIGIGLSEFIILVEKQTAAQILYTINRPQNMLSQSKSCQLLHKCRNKLYNKSTANRSNGVRGLQLTNVKQNMTTIISNANLTTF